MKKILKSRIFLVIATALVFTGIGVFADNLLASEVDYKETNVESALDSLYTTQNTTVANLTNQNSTLTTNNQTLTTENTNLSNQVTTLTQEKNELQSELNSLTTAASSFSFKSGLQTKTFNLGFRPNYINCVGDFSTSANYYVIITYNKDLYSNYAVRSNGDASDKMELSYWYTLTNNGFTWNINASTWNNKDVYCIASK